MVNPWAGAHNNIDYTGIKLGLKPLINFAPLQSNFNDVTTFKYPINIAKCRKDKVSANRTLFLEILSAPNYVFWNKRKLIRQTWLKHVRSALSPRFYRFYRLRFHLRTNLSHVNMLTSNQIESDCSKGDRRRKLKLR